MLFNQLVMLCHCWIFQGILKIQRKKKEKKGGEKAPQNIQILIHF